MFEDIVIKILDRIDYLKNPMEIGLDEKWKRKSVDFGDRMKMQGIYIFHVSMPQRIIYVGKTRGETMDFHTRLYRHATKSASQSNPKVYEKLRKIQEDMGCPILVSLITIAEIRDLFKGKPLEDAAMIDIYEQVLIHFLKPEVQ